MSKTKVSFAACAAMVIAGGLLFVNNKPEAQTVSATLFYSSMEAPTFGDWGHRDTSWRQSDNYSYCDSKSAAINGKVTNGMIVTPAISTVGYSNLKLSYAYRITKSLEGTDSVKVEWSDGGSWNTLKTYSNISAGNWTEETISLPSGAENKTNLKIRFRANLSSRQDEFRLDCVKLAGDVACNKIYSDPVCVRDGFAKKDYVWNNQACGENGFDEVSSSACDCSAGEVSRTCSGDGRADVIYRYNFAYCGNDYVESVQDSTCVSGYECGGWEDVECSANGTMAQTRVCTDQYQNTYTENRGNTDASCGCSPVEVDRSCVADGQANVSYGWNFGYCGENYSQNESDQSCACGYSEWSNTQCAGNGWMGQLRTQTTQFEYCTALTREVEDESCFTEEVELTDGACGPAAKTYAYNVTGFDGALCAAGDTGEEQWQFPGPGGSVTWTCYGENEGTAATCTATRGTEPTQTSSSSGSSGSSSGQYAPGFGPMASSGVTPQVLGAGIDLDDIANQISQIRQKVSDIASQVMGMTKGVLGAATQVATGACDAENGGSLFAKLRAQFCR